MAIGILLVIVVLAVLLLTAGASVLAVLRVQPAGPIAGGGTCGRCGYNVRGIESLTCPECGADLREIGITSTQRPRTGLFLGASIAWLVSMSVLGMAIGLMLMASIDFSTRATGRASATWIMLCVMLMVALVCVSVTVWMHRRTQASAAALTGVLLVWGFCITALLLLVGGLRF